MCQNDLGSKTEESVSVKAKLLVCPGWIAYRVERLCAKKEISEAIPCDKVLAPLAEKIGWETKDLHTALYSSYLRPHEGVSLRKKLVKFIEKLAKVFNITVVELITYIPQRSG